MRFIEVTSPTSKAIRWCINADHIIQVRRVTEDDECVIALVSGQVTPAETYDQVIELLRQVPLTA